MGELIDTLHAWTGIDTGALPALLVFVLVVVLIVVVLPVLVFFSLSGRRVDVGRRKGSSPSDVRSRPGR